MTVGRCPCLGFADQHVEVFGHDYISDYHKAVALPGLFQQVEEKCAPLRFPEQWQAAVATASDEMQVVRAIVSVQAPGHASRLAG